MEKIFIQYYFISRATSKVYRTPYTLDIDLMGLSVKQYVDGLQNLFLNYDTKNNVIEESRKLLREHKATHLMLKYGTVKQSKFLHEKPIVIVSETGKTFLTLISQAENKRLLQSWNIFETPKENIFETPAEKEERERIEDNEKLTKEINQFLKETEINNEFPMLSDITNRLYAIFKFTFYTNPGINYKTLNADDSIYQLYLKKFADGTPYHQTTWFKDQSKKYDEKEFHKLFKTLCDLGIIKYIRSNIRDRLYINFYKYDKVLNTEELSALNDKINAKRKEISKRKNHNRKESEKSIENGLDLDILSMDDFA